MSALLCLRVRQAYISESIQEKLQTYVVIKFDYVKTSTVVATGRTPLWEQDFIFEITPDSDCVAFELWGKTHDEAAEQMIGALCIPLDHVTRIDQNGVIIGSGGYGDWYTFDTEFIIQNGCIAGTREQTGHSLLLDAYVEEPFGYSPEDLAAYYYHCGVPPDIGIEAGQFPLHTSTIQQHFNDCISCDSDYTSDTAYHSGHALMDMNYHHYDYNYNELGMVGYGAGDHAVPGAWYPQQNTAALTNDVNYAHVNGERYYSDQWGSGIMEHMPYDARQNMDAALQNHYQEVPDDWSYYLNEQIQALTSFQDPEFPSTRSGLFFEHDGNTVQPKSTIEDTLEVSALDLSASSSPAKTLEYTEGAISSQSATVDNKDAAINQNFTTNSYQQKLPSSSEAELLDPNHNFIAPLPSPTGMSSRRLPTLQIPTSKSQFPASSSNEQESLILQETRSVSSSTAIAVQPTVTLPCIDTSSVLGDDSTFPLLGSQQQQQHSVVDSSSVPTSVTPVSITMPAPAYINAGFQPDVMPAPFVIPQQQQQETMPFITTTAANLITPTPAVIQQPSAIEQPQQQPLFPQQPYLPETTRVPSVSIQQQSLIEQPIQPVVPTKMEEVIESPKMLSPSPSLQQKSPISSPPPSKSPSLEPVRQPDFLRKVSPSPSVHSQISKSPIPSPAPSAGPSPSSSLTFAKSFDQKPPGVLSPSPSTDRVEAMRSPSPPAIEIDDRVSEYDDQEREIVSKLPIPADIAEDEADVTAKADEQALLKWHHAFGRIKERIGDDNLLSEETDGMGEMLGGNDKNLADFYNQINTSSDLKPRFSKLSHVSELTVAANKRKAEAQAAVITSRALNDDELKLHVYKKTLQALLYPMSKTSGDHKFEFFSAKHPTYCFECEGLLWGLARQGLRCTQCGVKCHDRCKALMNADCLQRAAEKSARQGAHDRAQVFMNIITDLMKKREVEKKETFELVRKIFKMDDKAHQAAIEQSKQHMLDGASKWSANISITVVSAQGLMGKDATGTSDPYVTIQLGRTKKRSKTKFKTLNPEWNEKFCFECHNISERIKIRVWDEDDDLKSRLRQKFTRESDDFLGQYIIDVAKLCGDSDIWCNLEKRTDRSMVSGAIRLQISIEIKGEEKVAPYYDQYTCLHENFFHYIYDQPNSPPLYIPPGDSTDAWEQYFEPQVQEIVEEFAQRYGIDRIYMAMTHFSCLATKLLNPSVPPLLSDLLAHINVHYAHSATTTGSSMSGSGNNSQSRFNASNFRKEKFTKLLDQLHNSIRLELIDYRNNFPASEPMRLRDLQACVDLLTSINFFRMKLLSSFESYLSRLENAFHRLDDRLQKVEAVLGYTLQSPTDIEVQGLVSPPKASAVVEECIKANMRRTYQFLYDHCYELYQKEFETTDENKAQQSDQEEDRGPVLKNLDFWHKLIALMVSVIEEDRNTYGPVLNQFPTVKVGDISAIILWQQLADDLEGALLEHEKARTKCKSSEYMNLHFKIKWLYSKYIAVLPEMKTKVAEYPRWFEAFVMIWLNDNDEVSLDCVKSAYERDKRDGFPKTSEQTNFSNSVVDMFSQLTQCHDVIKKLECPDPAIRHVYMSRFAKTVEKVLISYGEFIENDFIHFITDQKTTCILMNNMQQTRVNLEKLFELMGGKELDKNAAEVLNELQERLNSYLDRLCAMCAEGLSNQIREQIFEMSKLLQTKIKGNQPNQPLTNPAVIEQIHQDSDTVVQPLMEYLENCISIYADNCDKTILKRMLKELWVVTLTNLEKTIVLPPQDTKKLSLANLGADSAKDKVKDVSSLLFNKASKVANVNVASIIQDISRDSEKSLSARQCAVISAALETIKGYFHADGQGLKMPYLEKSAQLKSLQYALSLYTHTTDMLIKTFVQSQAKQEANASNDGAGNVNVQIELFTHPGTGENKLSVTVNGCNNLRWANSARPFVSVSLVGPILAQKKRKWDTKSKTGTLAPVFNETFKFIIGNEGEITDFELQFSVKDYCFGSDDKIIGVTVVKMIDLVNVHQGALATWLPLASQLKLDDTGYTILRILSQRNNDDIAKEFVRLKSERRPVQ